MIGLMLEPADGSRYALESNDGDLTVIYRDDRACQGVGDDDERWFRNAHDDPMNWTNITAGARAIHALVPIADADHSATEVHTHFGLDYTNYLVLHRTLLQSMPESWQYPFVALVRQLADAFAHVERAQMYTVEPAVEREVWDLNDNDMAQLGYRRVDEAGEVSFYDPDGNEIEGWHRIAFPSGDDPVPHYNRGRTRIEPNI